jgi:hypothetical protein
MHRSSFSGAPPVQGWTGDSARYDLVLEDSRVDGYAPRAWLSDELRPPWRSPCVRPAVLME